jgi:hypothetical protein
MKKTPFILILFSLLAVFHGGLLAAKKEVNQRQKANASVYLKHVFPSALSFGIDPLPADRMMLVTKAPKLNTGAAPLPQASVVESNSTTEIFPPLEIIDPPASLLAEPALPVPPSHLMLPGTGLRRVNSGSSSLVTSDEILRLFQLDGDSTLKSKQSIIVPFELPHAQTPPAAVLSSRARYIKRIK